MSAFHLNTTPLARQELKLTARDDVRSKVLLHLRKVTIPGAAILAVGTLDTKVSHFSFVKFVPDRFTLYRSHASRAFGHWRKAIGARISSFSRYRLDPFKAFQAEQVTTTGLDGDVNDTETNGTNKLLYMFLVGRQKVILYLPVAPNRVHSGRDPAERLELAR